MLLEGLLAVVVVTSITLAVTAFVLEIIGMPALTDEEWELRYGTKPYEDTSDVA